MKSKTLIGMMLALILVQAAPALAAPDDVPSFDDIQVFGLELEKLLNLGSGALALVLCALTALAFKRTHNRRLVYVSGAFLLFGVKALLMGTEVFFGEWPYVDQIASVLDFAILLAFFLGIMKK